MNLLGHMVTPEKPIVLIDEENQEDDYNDDDSEYIGFHIIERELTNVQRHAIRGNPTEDWEE